MYTIGDISNLIEGFIINCARGQRVGKTIAKPNILMTREGEIEQEVVYSQNLGQFFSYCPKILKIYKLKLFNNSTFLSFLEKHRLIFETLTMT